MERQQRMENALAIRDNMIKQLNIKNSQLQKQLGIAKRKIQNLQDRAHKSFSYQNIPEREMIQTLQTKIAASAWQISQLQKENFKHTQNIIRLQSQLSASRQELQVRIQQLNEKEVAPQVTYIQDYSITQTMKQWEQTIRQKNQLAQQKLRLQQKLNSKQFEISDKMAFYLNQTMTLGSKLKNQTQNQKVKINQFELLIKQLLKQNEDLRETLRIKNEQICLYFQENKMISTDKASDLHTIRNLRNQIKKKGEQLFKVFKKLKQTQQLKQKLIQTNTQCAQYMGQFNRLSQICQNVKRQNALLDEKYIKLQKRLRGKQNILQQNHKKLHELLVQNEACHELLYATRGYSHLFKKDVEDKVQRFLKNLQRRRQRNQTWLDVSELININEQLRLKSLANS